MTGTPTDPAAGKATSAPQVREARDAKPQRRAGTPAGPARPPASGPATPTSRPAAATPAPLPGGTQTPAGGAQRAVATSAPLAGQAARDAWKTAESVQKAGKRRARFTRAAPRTGPGMIRKMPPSAQGEA